MKTRNHTYMRRREMRLMQEEQRRELHKRTLRVGHETAAKFKEALATAMLAALTKPADIEPSTLN